MVAGVGPVIVISACGLLCSTFYNRITNVIVRLRAFQRERLTEQAAMERETDPAAKARRRELLEIFQTQTDSLVRRIRLIRGTLFCLLFTIAAMVLCSLALGLSVMLPGLLWLAAAFFIVGLSLLLGAIGFAVLDLRVAIDPVVLETAFVTKRVRGADQA